MNEPKPRTADPGSARAWRWLSTVAGDGAYALRQMRRSPALATAAVVSLGLGIAANVTVFSLVDAMWLRRLPVRAPEGLVRVSPLSRSGEPAGVSWPELERLRRGATTLTGLTAHYSTAPLQVNAGGEAGEVNGAVVNAIYFPLLGLAPARGRFFLPAEDAVPGRDAVAVVSFDFWRRRLGGGARVPWRESEISINGVVFRVVGVAPDGFNGVQWGQSTVEVWIPAMMIEVGYRWCSAFRADCAPFALVARLAPGRTVEQAQAEMSALVAADDADRGQAARRGALVEPAVGLPRAERRAYSAQILMLATTAGVLLLLACGNVAGLVLARAAGRRQEIAVRRSLGAGNARLVRQLLTESVVLAAAGAALGLLLTLWARDLLVAFYATDAEGYHALYDLDFDGPVLGFTLALTLLTALLFGLAPALRAARQDVAPALRDGAAAAGGGRRSLLRSGLVTAQLALSVALLVAAGLLAQSAVSIERGIRFDPRGVAVLRLRPRLVQMPPARAQAFMREVVRRLEALPGVASVSLARGSGLVWQGCCRARLALPGRPPARPEDAPEAGYQVVGPRYFATLRIPLLAGRELDERDRAGAPAVAIVNQTLAKKLSPGGAPVGRLFAADGRLLRVAGVAADAQYHNALASAAPFFYLAFWQSPEEIDARLAVRVRGGDPRSMLPRLRRAIAAIDPAVPVTEQMTLIEQVEGEFAQPRLAAAVTLVAGGLALLASAIGLYSVIAYGVRQRTREIGMRMALGARRVDVLRLVLGEAGACVAAGVVLGLAGAAGASRLLGSWLYEVRADDPAAFAAGALVLAAVALLAAWLPARRAAALDPAAALRGE